MAGTKSPKSSTGTLGAVGRKPYPKGVWFQPKRLASGVVVRYGYYGRGPGTVPLGREGTADFYQALSGVADREPVGDTVHRLIYRYRASPEFEKLRPRTKLDYRQMLDRVDREFGPLTLRVMADPRIIRHIHEWRNGMGAAPRRADYAVQVLKALLSWGKRLGYLNENRASGVGRLGHSDRREKVWSEVDVQAFLTSAPEPLKRALTLALETGQRQADLLTLPWSAVEPTVIRLRQQKTKVRVAVPISPMLRATLDEAPRSDAVTVLTNSNGLPWEPKGNGFRAAWQKACRAAGVTGVTFHDLRGTFVTRRLADGWTTHEVASCTGHSLRDLAMLDAYADRGTIADAIATRIAERNAK